MNETKDDSTRTGETDVRHGSRTASATEKAAMFTEGPWTFDSRGDDRIRAGGYCIALVTGGLDNDVDFGQTSEANAHLIAAAPDLYAALKHYVAEHTRESYDMALAAIAKAEGR